MRATRMGLDSCIVRDRNWEFNNIRAVGGYLRKGNKSRKKIAANL